MILINAAVVQENGLECAKCSKHCQESFKGWQELRFINVDTTHEALMVAGTSLAKPDGGAPFLCSLQCGHEYAKARGDLIVGSIL